MKDPASNGPSGDFSGSESLFDQAATMLFQLGRTFAHLPLPTNGDGAVSSRTAVQVCLAIVRGQDAGADVTVGWVAGALGVEASTASRLVAQTIAAGLVQSTPAPGDRRRLVLDLTAAGVRLAHDARRYPRRVFDELTASWDPADRETFARLFVVFAGDVIRRTAAERP